VVRTYQETVRERPLLRLVQDLSQRIAIYRNILEEAKRQDGSVGTEPTMERSPTAAEVLKTKYENLGLVPPATLPNPLMREVADFALRKLRRFGTLLLDLMATQAEAISAELKVSPEVTVTFQVELDWAPSLTVGIERLGRREMSQPNSNRG